MSGKPKKCYLALMLLLSGCSSVSYISYTDQQYPAREHGSSFLFLVPDYNEQPYTVIGNLSVLGGSGILTQMSALAVRDKFVKEALERGAYATVNIEASSESFVSYLVTPGSTEYETVTSQHFGNFSGTSYNNLSRSRFQGNYSGMSQTTIPVHTPPTVTPYHVTVNALSGDLIVFEE